MQRERDERASAHPDDSTRDGIHASGPRRLHACDAGWALPLTIEDQGLREGRPDPLVDTARLVLEVVPGERRLLPGFGCRIHHLPRIETPRERHIAAVLVEESLESWVPGLGVERADVLDVDEDLVDLALRVSGGWRRLRIRYRRESADGIADSMGGTGESLPNDRSGAQRVEDNVR